MRIGVLGGTFDPVHNGHIGIANACMKAGNLGMVAFVPAGDPWMKKDKLLSPARLRKKMAQLAVEGDPRFEMWDLEVKRRGPTFTVDTLEELSKKRGPGDEYFLIVGADALEQFGEWKHPERILALAKLMAVPRNGFAGKEPAALRNHPAKNPEQLLWVEGPVSDISASQIRKRAADNLPIDHLVPEKVAKFILERHLYRKTAVRSNSRRNTKEEP